MSHNTQLSIVPSPDYTVEFRAYKDDAWYTVTVLLVGETLNIKYLNFSDDHDDLYKPTDFKTLEERNEFKARFRPLSKQVQDNECRQLVKGVKVCACHSFGDDDVRFYDAFVDEVQENEHTTKADEEVCLCTFILFWLHGPNAGNLTASKIEDICIVQTATYSDPAVASFLKMAREKTECISSLTSSRPMEVSGLEMVAYSNKGSSTARRRSCSLKKNEDNDLERIKTPCMILVGNLDKDLCSSTVIEFLHRHTSVSPRVFIFPSLPSEIFTGGAIALDSEKDFRKLRDFLTNPNSIITSSAGRPWVVLETLVGLKKIKASVGKLVPTSQNGNSETSNDLKVVHSGSKEFKMASDRRNLFLEFSSHMERLYKRLALEELKIFASESIGELA
ncbi:hypothetical protein RIF29_26980 [Crotalaria pallida]|uniref:SAWADEE domain-containing protein n=1 Tax=Crotalaria pallida TaxID=3830 RepID=A0AAN9I1Z1_CROPI